MTNNLAHWTDEEIAATCSICTLSATMRDCKACAFRNGLVSKGMRAIKQAEPAHDVSNLRSAFVESLQRFGASVDENQSSMISLVSLVYDNKYCQVTQEGDTYTLHSKKGMYPDKHAKTIKEIEYMINMRIQ